MVPVYGCSASKVQVPDVAVVPGHDVSNTLASPPDFSVINILNAAQNFNPSYEENEYEIEHSVSLTDKFILFDEYHEEEVIGFPTLLVYEPELIEDPLDETLCADSAFAWCDPRYEDEYLAYLMHEKEQKYQAAIFPNFVSPVDEGLILRGMQPPKKRRRGHYGLDIIPSAWKRGGVPIRSVEDGAVVRSSRARGYGYYVVIYHQNGIFSLYSHLLKKKRVKAGQEVHRGDVVGLMGKSGNARGYHLHFELIDLRENWCFEESIDLFMEKICQGEQLAYSERERFSKLLFAKSVKKDPLPNIPGLTFAKKVKGKWVAIEPASQPGTKTADAKKK